MTTPTTATPPDAFSRQNMEDLFWFAWGSRERYDELEKPKGMDYEEVMHYTFDQYMKRTFSKNGNKG